MNWRPIETAPYDSAWILTSEADGELNIAIWDNSPTDKYGDEIEPHLTNGAREINPTHWMPLHDPPLPDQQSLPSEQALAMLRSLTNDDRIEIFGHFCTRCGDNNPSCQCWNDN